VKLDRNKKRHLRLTRYNRALIDEAVELAANTEC